MMLNCVMIETFFFKWNSFYCRNLFSVIETYFFDKILFLWQKHIFRTVTYFSDINLFLWQKLILVTETFFSDRHLFLWLVSIQNPYIARKKFLREMWIPITSDNWDNHFVYPWFGVTHSTYDKTEILLCVNICSYILT